jgi:hypothetical protein
MQEICPKFFYVTRPSLVGRKLVEGHVTSNRLHKLYLCFAAVRVRGLTNDHSTLTIETRTHNSRNFFDHKDLENYLIQLCP